MLIHCVQPLNFEAYRHDDFLIKLLFFEIRNVIIFLQSLKGALYYRSNNGYVF